jgi:hypothetical protein
MISSIWTFVGSALIAAFSLGWAYVSHKKSQATVSDVKADAAQQVAAAQADRDQAVVAVEQARNVISKANEAAAQESVDAAKERANVDQEAAAAPRANNLQWMRDNGFLRDAGAPTETVDRGTGSAGTNQNR